MISRKDIIRWWEKRRIRYNLYVGIVGVITWIVVWIAGSAAVRPGEDYEEPIVMLVGPIAYGIAANVLLALTAVPGLLAIGQWLYTVHTGHKLGPEP